MKGIKALHRPKRDIQASEQAGSAAPTEGAVEGAEVQAKPSALSALRRALRPLADSRRVQAAAGLGAAGIIVVAALAVAVGPFAPGAASPTLPASQTALATAGGSSTPSPTRRLFPSYNTQSYPPLPSFSTEIVIPQPTETWNPDQWPYDSPYPPLDAKGWPVELVGDYWGAVVVGPDGTIYVDGYEPLTPAGRTRTNWLKLPDGSYWPPVAFGWDGAAFALTWPDYSSDYVQRLWSFDASGKPRAGWPVEVAGDAVVLAGPSGSAYVLSSTEGVDIYGASGNQRARLKITGDYYCGYELQPDGTLFLAVGSGEVSYPPADCKIRTVSAAGKETTKASSWVWDGLTKASDGTVAAWGHDPQPSGLGTAQTRIALIGTDGLPLPGWPVAFDGTASPPVFGPDGSLFVTLYGLGTAPSKVAALNRDGTPRSGWPVAYPAGYGPREWDEPPTIGADGSVYFAAVDLNGLGYVIGLGATGAPLPGWPYHLPKPFATFDDLQPHMFDSGWIPNPTPLYVPGASGGLVYLALEDRILALDASGKVASGWPYTPRTDVIWSHMAGTPDGGIVVVEEIPDEEGYGILEVRCLTAAGRAPK